MWTGDHEHTDDCWRTCVACKVRWHLPLSERRSAPRKGWLCYDCLPSAAHCATCTCYEVAP